MVALLTYGYLSGWVVVTLGAAVLARRVRDENVLATHSALMSIIAGAAWPVLLLALAQAGAVALTVEALHEDDRLILHDV